MKIFDGHNDILNKITNSANPKATRGFLQGGEGQLDLPRALQGGMCGGLFAVFPSDPPEVPPEEDRILLSAEGYEISPSPPLDFGYASRAARGMIDLLESIERDSQGLVRIVRSHPQLLDCLEAGIFAAVLHLEGAEPIAPDLSNLEYFYRRGMRSLGITWSRPNPFGWGVPFKYPSLPDTGPGLTPAGKDLVQACNKLGILVDLAHLTARGFWDVAELSSAPLVSSHSAAWALIPKARNLTDDQLKALAESDGLVGIIFSVNDLDGERRPKNDGPITAITRHIAYISELIGVDHVAFGSDFDGTRIPSELGDARGYPRLVSLLEEAGFSHQEREKICFGNWVRVLEKTWKD